MAKLVTIKARVATIAPLIGRKPNDEKARLKERDENVPWRGWYKTARWERLRQKVLLRDSYRCQQTGMICAGKYPAPDSPTIDHIIPHRGDETLFWDIDNLQTVTKAYHDSEKQRQERALPYC